MPSAVTERREGAGAGAGRLRGARRAGAALWRAAAVRELLVVLAFCAFTALLTWPYVTRLRDAVVDPGDPYLVTWIMWWDYHQTFRDPLNLFHSNTFYPLRYTLAFSEHCYGLALPFFPLFAAGLRPLTVHAVAVFLGFALSGYGAFRLARTLTGSRGVAWVAGVVFAFVPYRFHLMSQLVYLFSPWIPLLFEALVLFARARTRRRAAWLGAAFFMTGLTSVSFFAFALLPLAAAGAVLLTRYGLWRERELWRRGAAALGLASLALLPFMLPYYHVSKLYGFKRSVEEVKANSAWASHWLSSENRNKLWFGMGETIKEGARFKLFPGLLPLLFALAALLLVEPLKGRARAEESAAAGAAGGGRSRRLARLDALAVFAFAASLLALGFDGTDYFGGLFRYVTSERALALLAAALIARACLAYPAFLRATHANLAATLRSPRRCDAFWLGLVLACVGFCYSLGWNFFFYRICYDLLPVFRSMRVPTRGSMFAYLGIALLAGLGVRRLAELLSARRPRLSKGVVYAAACALLLAELNAAPLNFMRGAVNPDAVSLRLKRTEMRGGVVVLPAGPDFNHLHMLRAADHARPLIVGTSGFNSPQADQVEHWTRAGTIPMGFMNLLEEIPASYVVVKNELIPERRATYTAFLTRAVSAGRLRFINRFDGRDDLYAVVKTEPEARAEASPPPELEIRDWATLLEEDPVNLLGPYAEWSRALYRLHLVRGGRVPRYADFMADARGLGRGLVPGFEEAERDFEGRLRGLAAEWARGAEFRQLYEGLDDARFAERLYQNAGLEPEPSATAALAASLASGAETRAGALLSLAADPRVVERERNRSVLLLHYFGFLRRNPDDPPDNSLEGFNFWLAQLDAGQDPGKLPLAFRESFEYEKIKGK